MTDFFKNMDLETARRIAARRTPKPQAGTWTLTAPDGRTWTAEGPLQCVTAEVNDRIPPDVALARIRMSLEDETAPADEDAKPSQVVAQGMDFEKEWSQIYSQAAGAVDPKASELERVKAGCRAVADAAVAAATGPGSSSRGCGPQRVAPLPCSCPTRDALDALLCAVFRRRSVVEQALFDMAAGKLPMPDAAKLRELAGFLGAPDNDPPGARPC